MATLMSADFATIILENQKREHGERFLHQQMKYLQISLYTMIGGGQVANLAVTNPQEFEMGDKRRPYGKTKILTMVEILIAYAKVLNLNPQDLKFEHGFYSGDVF